MPEQRKTLRRFMLTAACCLALTGCKEVLFSELDETQANEMIAVLAAAGIDGSRQRDKNNVYAIEVHPDNVAVATTLLRQHGFPKPKFQTLGEVFTAEGIVGTPFEQHVRYIHAMNEELSRTVSAISGVQSARVFITAPPKDRYARQAPPATASVTINHEVGFDAQANIPKIKSVVAHSVQNLEYDNVAIALFVNDSPVVHVTTPEQPSGRPIEASVLPEINSSNVTRILGWVLTALGTLSLMAAIWFWIAGPLAAGRAAGQTKSDSAS